MLALLLVAGFLIRGPLGVVIPAGVVFSHLLLTHACREIVLFAALSAAILLAVAAAVEIGLRQRLRDDSREPTLIKTVRGEGYVLAASVEGRSECA